MTKLSLNSRLVISLICAICITVVITVYTILHRPSLDFDPIKGNAILPPQKIPPFELTDYRGLRFSNANLRGHWTLLFSGYTYCPDICPTTLLQLAAYFKDKGTIPGKNQAPEVVFLSVDPFRDTSIVLEKYVHYFNKSFLGVTGTPANIARFVKQTGLYYAYSDPDDNRFYDDLLHKPPIDDYVVTHSSRLLVLSPQGMLVASMTYPYDTKIIADFMTKLKKYYGDQQ